MDIQKNSILIVDDESLNITALSHILSPDYTIYVEKDGQGCIDSAKELKPDLILLDIIMPAMNGFDAIKILKETEETRDIPVVFVTGLNNYKDEELSFNLGASDYINKPFSAPVVKLRVKNQMQIVNQMRNIKKLSITDVLTGLSSRRHFNAVLNQVWRTAIRQGQHIGFMIIDINNFETYNDKYGHLRGDMVLKDLAHIIDKMLQGTSYQVARWGGEEFAIIMPQANMDIVYSLATRLSEAINGFDFVREGLSSNISVSIGVNALLPETEGIYTLDRFISDTTKALNGSKALQGTKILSAH